MDATSSVSFCGLRGNLRRSSSHGKTGSNTTQPKTTATTSRCDRIDLASTSPDQQPPSPGQLERLGKGMRKAGQSLIETGQKAILNVRIKNAKLNIKHLESGLYGGRPTMTDQTYAHQRIEEVKTHLRDLEKNKRDLSPTRT